MGDEVHGPLLQLANLTAGYGAEPILRDVALVVPARAIVALVGRNGAGKSTLLRAVFGLVPDLRGSITYAGRSIVGSSAKELVAAGISFLPQSHSVFDDLTVFENLLVLAPGSGGKDKQTVAALFPELGAHLHQRAGSLSGGEKQMLALGAISLRRPRLLLLDEPSIGLSVDRRQFLFRWLRQLREEQGVTILMVEQRIRDVLRIADFAYVLRRGGISFGGPATALEDEETLRREVLEL